MNPSGQYELISSVVVDIPALNLDVEPLERAAILLGRNPLAAKSKT